MMQLTKQFNPIRDWANQRNLIESGNPATQTVKLMEEVGELCAAQLMHTNKLKQKALIKDAIGDTVVVLTNLAAMHGLRIEDCINSAFAEIANRKGKMIGGTFVKDKIQ
jgi:NTP pyrophosphatase (non-canonical NTP hydrolase)